MISSHLEGQQRLSNVTPMRPQHVGARFSFLVSRCRGRLVVVAVGLQNDYQLATSETPFL